MLKIAVTGHPYSGKSTLLKALGKKFPVIYMDGIVAGIYAQNKVKKLLLERLGKSSKKGVLGIIGKKPGKLEALESVLHPFAKKGLLERFEALERKGAKIVAVEVPLLFEAGWQGMFDCSIAVIANKKDLEKRGKERKKKVHKAMLDRRLKQAEIVKKSDFSINTSKGKANAIKEMKLILETILNA